MRRRILRGIDWCNRRDEPTHGDETAMNGAPGNRRSFDYVWHRCAPNSAQDDSEKQQRLNAGQRRSQRGSAEEEDDDDDEKDEGEAATAVVAEARAHAVAAKAEEEDEKDKKKNHGGSVPRRF